jgi:hypothetical protein
VSYGTVTYGPAGGATEGAYGQPMERARAAWVVDCEPFVAERLKRWFKQIATNRTGVLEITATKEASRDLLWMLDRFPMTVADNAMTRLRALSDEYDEMQAVVWRILSGERLESATGWNEPAVPFYDFQLVASDLILALGRLLVGDDVGLGKTATAISTFRNPDALPAIVVCDSHLQRQWLRELGKFFPMLRGHIIAKRAAYDPSQRREMKGHHPDVLITSYAKADAWAPRLIGQVRTAIFDETQALRTGEGSCKYHGCTILAESARYVIGTTATPVYGYGGEIFNVADALERGVLGTRDEFARAWGGKVVGNPRALGAYLRDEVKLHLRRTRKDVGKELPELIRVPHDVGADLQTFDEELANSGAFAVAEMILSGAGDKHERFKARGDMDWQMRRATGIAKAPYVGAFIDLLLESERKVLVAGWHRDVYRVWLEQLAHHNPVMYTGSESAAKKDAMACQFVEDDATRIMLMSLRSGAGLDGLQEACKVCVFGELDWSPAMHDQLAGRLRRDGMDVAEPVVAYFLTCDFGSDPYVMEVLGVKRGQAEPLRDPDVRLFDQGTVDTGDRVRKLAEAAIARRRAAKPRIAA